MIMTLALQLIVIPASFALGKLRPGSGFIEILFLSGLFITSEMLKNPQLYDALKSVGTERDAACVAASVCYKPDGNLYYD